MSEPDPERVIPVLERFVSTINARVICERGKRILRDPKRIRADEWPLFLTTMRGAARLFLTEHQIHLAFLEVQHEAGPRK